jgi:hypothetical protein
VALAAENQDSATEWAALTEAALMAAAQEPDAEIAWTALKAPLSACR